MPEYIYRRWTPPEASSVADIHGWLQDINTARALFARLCFELEAASPDDILIDALSAAAVVRYSRCFTSGLRARLKPSEMLATSDAADLELHDRIRGVRDWHVAHPVNVQEAHTLMVIMEAEPYRFPGAIGFSSRATADLPLDPSEMDAAVRLCDRWIRFLEQRLVDAQEALIPLANRLSREELLALPQDELQTSQNIRARRQQRPK